MKIGILTGGGDVPGLNACIKAAVTRLTEAGHQMVGIRRGWAGLLHCNPQDPESIDHYIVPLERRVVRTIDRTGGTWLHTSRTNPLKVKRRDIPDFLLTSEHTEENVNYDFTPHVMRVIEGLGIHALMPIGGDDTLSFGLHLHNQGVPVVAIPKTMDNDVAGTDYCIGFSTAITRSVEFIHQLRTSTGSHERIAVIELFGRYSGETTLVTSYLSGVDRAIISEVPFDAQKLSDLLVADKHANPSNYAMVAISEGAKMIGGEMVMGGEADAFGHKKLGGIGAWIGEAIKQITGQNIIYQQLGYLMRSGAPDSLDLMVAVNFAVMAADLAMGRSFGRMVALRNGLYTNVNISITSEGPRHVDVKQLYDEEEYRPKVRHVDGKPMFLY